MNLFSPSNSVRRKSIILPSRNGATPIPSKKSSRQLKRVTFNLMEDIINSGPKEGPDESVGFLGRLFATVWGREQDPIQSLRHAKRSVLVLAYLHTTWSLPFDAVFRSSLVSPHGYIVDFVYLLDVAFELWFGFGESAHSQGYFRRKRIFDMRLGSCFALEVLMLAPYYVAYCVLSATGNVGSWSGAGVLLFASRIFQVNRVRLLKAFFREMEVSVDIDVRKTALVKYAAMIIGAAHWLGCIWWFLSSLNNFDNSTWVFHYCDSFLSPSAAAQAEGVPAYIAEHGVVEAYDLGDLSERYLLAVYWGFQSLTNLGYSDLIPDNAIEMVFAWFLCVFQVSFYAYILGTLFSFVVRKDGNAESYRKSIAALESYSRNRNLPKKLHDSLIRYFDFQLSKSDNDDNTQVVNSLPNTLLAKVADFKYSSIVLKAACFTTIPSEFLTSVLERLRPRFLMPNERLFNQGDMSRELCFVEKGTLLVYADNDEKIFVREVNNDTAETPMVGEYSFFLTVAQPEMVKTVSNGDVTVLVLSKEDYLSCLENYPESQSIISSRLLAELGLNSKGDEEEKNAANDNSSTDDFTKHLQQILRNRSAEALYEMIVAASEGDGRHVKDLLLQGLDINTCDFDQRTTLHLAAAQGNSKVVQLLLREGADVHAVDRYGNNPLHEAVSNNHVGVADMLGRAGAELNYEIPADYMTAAAGFGDLDKLQTLIAHGIDVNAADKDGRSSLHLVSSEGNLNVVEFLLAHEADANSKDRWGHTPLDGAVEKGHDLVAAALFARGGTMNMKTARSLLMKSARAGDLGTLKLLSENGIDVDVKDYDLCCALHVAAMADQPVAVDFLLSNKATVNLLSRWTTTPLDEAIKSQSVLSAKLLMACGGQTYCEHTEQNLGLVRDSDLTLSSLRKMISNEVNLQSVRRREMHKLKQMHIKLLDDVDEGNRVIQLQVQNQDAIVSKMANSRLAMDFPVFKESDLEFENLYIGLPSFEVYDKHLLRVIGSVIDGTVDDEDRQSQSGSEFEADEKKDERRSPKTTGGYSMMRFMQERQDEAKTVQKHLGKVNQFNTFNQVMLSLPKVEEGFLHLLKCFEKRSSSFRSCGVLSLIGEELVDCFRLCGVAQVDEAKVIAFIREVHEYTPPDNVDETNFDRTSELDVTFGQVIGSQFAVDLFAPEYDVSETSSKVCGAFRIVRSTFNLLDTDGDGDISPEELQSSRMIIGDLSYGNELFKSFDGMPSVSIGEMAEVFAKWTLLSEGDEYAVMKREAEGNSVGVNSAASDDDHSDVSSVSVTDFVEDAKSPSTSKDDTASVHGAAVSFALEKSAKKRGFFQKFLGNAGDDSANSDDVVATFTELVKTQTKNSFARFSREGKEELTKEEFTKLVQNVMDTASDKIILELFDRFSDESGEAVPFVNIKNVSNAEQSAKPEAELTALVESNKTKKNSSKSWVIHEGDALHRAIVFARFLAAIYYLMVVPYECALIHPRATADTESVSMQIFVVGWCVDTVLFLDLLSKFHLTYTNRRGLKVDSLVKIRKHYLAHGFTFDLVAILPIDLIVYATLNTSVTRLGYFRLPKLLRCVDIINHFSGKLAKASASTRIKTEIQILFSLLFSLLHVSACLWFALTDPTVDSNGNTYLDNYNGKFDGFGSVSSSEIYFEQYLLALYWVTGTLTTMGQGGGDLMPQNSRERIFSIYLMTMNLSIYAYILGVISNLFMSADEAIVQKRAEISALERYISSNKIDATLEMEIRSAMSNNGQHGVSVEEERAVFKKLSHSLQVQVSRHTSSELVDNVKAFKDCDQHFRENVCTELTEENFGPGTYIIKKKDPCHSFFVVAAGTVDLVGQDEGSSVEERKMAEVGIGGVIGEIPFFFNMRHSDTYRTSMDSHVRVFVMSKDKYDRLVKLYPNEEEKITQNVLSQIDLNRNGGGKRKGSGSVSDAASSVASGDNSSVGDSSMGEGSQVSGDGASDIGSDEDGFRADTDDDHVDMVKRAIEKKREKRALQSHYALCLAAGKGEVDVLRKAINAGLNIDQCQYFGRSPLHIASSEGNLAVVKYLTPLMESPNIFDRRNNTPLMDAVRHTHSEVAKYLKSVGCTLNEDFASKELSTACADGDEKKVELLLQLDVNPSLNPPGRRRGASRRRRSAAHMAASNNHVGCMRLLIKYWSKLNTFDAWGGTPLADAIRHDHVHMQDVLRKAGAKLKEVGLCTAASAGDLDTIRLMCDNGADINVTNYIGRTMLHLACSNKQPSVIEYLLGFNHIDLNPCDWYGGTPLDDADREANTSIAVMIQEAGGKNSKDSSLQASLAEMQNKRMSEKEKAEKQRETEKKLDALRGQVLVKVSKIGQVAILDIASLKRLWDSLALSLNTNTWRKQQALDKSPKPSLAEVLQHFRASFASFMKIKYAINKLNCYEVIASFASLLEAGKVQSPSQYMNLVVSIFDEYFEESSPAYVSVNPLTISKLVSFVKDKAADSSRVIQNSGYDTKTKKCSKNVYQKVLDELEASLIDDYLPVYFKSQEYKAIHRHPSGRVWRVKHMCKTARIFCNNIELELANVVEKMVKDDEMKDMYKGSTGYNNLTLEGACALKTNVQNCRDRIETITVIMSSVYGKAHKKASILSQQRQARDTKGGDWKGVKA